ncbi:transposase [Citreicoccus inhibens]|uniref:transposase n=1 Tax=Citreicoccus inhibens TaxID=2849499 RepID=UPI0038B2A9AC
MPLREQRRQAVQKGRFSEDQMIAILREVERASVPETAKSHGVSEPTVYAWRNRFVTDRRVAFEGRTFPFAPHARRALVLAGCKGMHHLKRSQARGRRTAASGAAATRPSATRSGCQGASGRRRGTPRD